MNLEQNGNDVDVELRLVDPARNRFRVYGLTRGRTLFGELCLRVAWGRLGHRSLRERTELFAEEGALERRRVALLRRRRRRGYVPLGVSWPALLGESGPLSAPAPRSRGTEGEREIVEAHGLSPDDRQARELVSRWQAATSALRAYVRASGQMDLDCEDVSTLAAMYASVCRVA